MTLKQKAMENTEGRGENAGNQHFLLFPQCFLLYYREKSSFKQPLSSANDFNLVTSTISLFGKELNK